MPKQPKPNFWSMDEVYRQERPLDWAMGQEPAPQPAERIRQRVQPRQPIAE